MTETEKRFIRLAFVEQVKYPEISRTLNVPFKQLTEWTKQHISHQKKIASLRNLYKRKKFSNLNWADFYDWHTTQEEQCYYCGITSLQIAQLLEKGLVRTKRIITRGKTLELERLLPNESYNNVSNLKLCCYWCNNAKSDEFSEVEFKPVAIQIANIWKRRLLDNP